MKRYFITGLLIWVPLGITLWVLNLIIGSMDQTLLLLPHAWRPEAWLGMRLPGLGVVLTLAVILLTGLVTANIIGQRLLLFWESLLGRIPVVKSISLQRQAGVRHVIFRLGRGVPQSAAGALPAPGGVVSGISDQYTR